MQYNEKENEHIEGISIVRDSERIFYALVTIDTHSTEKSAHRDALALIYTDILLSGCGTYTRKTFLDALNVLGASISVGISEGRLTITLKCLNTHREKLLTLFTTMLKEPTFVASEVKRIKEHLTNELQEAKEDAKLNSMTSFVNELYKNKDRRYTFSQDALISETPKVTRAELQKFHTEVTAHKWTYTLSSNAPEALKTVTKFENLKKNFSAQVTQPGKHIQNSIETKKVLLASIPSKQNIELNIGAPLDIDINSTDYFAFMFGLTVLGKWGGFAGRLMSTIREKEGLTYGIYANMQSTTKTEKGYWRIMTFFAPDKAIQGINSTLIQVEKIRAKGITEDEYARFKNILETEQVLLGDSLLKNVYQTHMFQLKGFSCDEIIKYKKRIAEVTKSEVNQALKKYLHISKLVISAAGPVLKKEKELKAL